MIGIEHPRAKKAKTDENAVSKGFPIFSILLRMILPSCNKDKHFLFVS